MIALGVRRRGVTQFGGSPWQQSLAYHAVLAAATRNSKNLQPGYQAALAYAQCMRTHGVPGCTGR